MHERDHEPLSTPDPEGIGRIEDVRRHGLRPFILAYMVAFAFFLSGYQHPEMRAVVWTVALVFLIGRHLIGSPMATVRIGDRCIEARGVAYRARIDSSCIRAVLFGSGDYSDPGKRELWPIEARRPKEQNTGSSRFVVLLLDRFHWRVGNKLIIPTADAAEAEEAVARLRRACAPGGAYRRPGV